jgi:hypothetical protein
MSQRHGKCSFKVTSSKGTAWTTKRGAYRMVDCGLAVFVDNTTLEMVETDHRFMATPGGNEGALLEVVDAPFRPYVKLLIPQGFLRYPQPGSFVRRKPLKEPIDRFDRAA